MDNILRVGDLCQATIYSAARREIHDCVIVEICGAAVVRVQFPGRGSTLRICASQLKKLGEGYKIHKFLDNVTFVK